MSLKLSTRSDDPVSPVDILEAMVAANDWPFERPTDDDIAVEIARRYCCVRLFFAWHEDLRSLYVTGTFDARIPSDKRRAFNDLVAIVNETMWLGHFALCPEDQAPIFRYTLPLRGQRMASVEQLEDLMDAALLECDRFFPALQMVLWGGANAGAAVAAALLEPAGEA
jgi:hypothetical protein